MRITLNWLKDFLITEADIQVIAETLVSLGIEVESVIDRRQELDPFVVAQVVSIYDHPNSLKLKICEVDDGQNIVQVVCGARNVRAGIKVILAPIGSVVPKDQFLIKAVKIRGITSNGMICSGQELMINNDDEGIMILPETAEIGSKLINYYGLSDPVLKLSITPNRGDCLSVYGIARELAAKGIGELKPLMVPQFDNDLKVEFDSQLTVEVENFSDCSLFSLWPLRNLKNVPSPIWLQERLISVDLKPVSALVDITNYIAHSFGQPLHIYDNSKIGKNIAVAKAREGYIFVALNQKQYKLASSDLVVSDEDRVLAIAGIMGGEESICTLSTTEALLEAAIFDKVAIFNTGQRLQLSSAAGYRFERHVDPDFTLTAASFAVKMILEICGGKLSRPAIVKGGLSERTTIKFDLQLLQKKSGIMLHSYKVEEVLTKLGFVIGSKIGGSLEVVVPSWRADVTIAEDLVEEVLRLYGYDNVLMQELPLKLNTRLLSPEQQRKENLRRVLASLGYFEVLTWSFMSSSQAALFAEYKAELCLINPISAELDYMRPSIIPNLLNLIVKNKARSIDQLALFEIGPVFNGLSLHNENVELGIVRCGPVLPMNPYEPFREVDVFDLKGEAEYLLSELGIISEQFKFDNKLPNYYNSKKSIRILLAGKPIGYIGEINSAILCYYGIPSRVVALELFIDNLPRISLNYGKKKEKFKYINYPAVKRDFAFIVDQNQPLWLLLGTIRQVNPKLIRETKVFDIYKGTGLEPNKKSVAINCLIQSDDHTLTEFELSELHNQIVTTVEAKFGAKLR